MQIIFAHGDSSNYNHYMFDKINRFALCFISIVLRIFLDIKHTIFHYGKQKMPTIGGKKTIIYKAYVITCIWSVKENNNEL